MILFIHLFIYLFAVHHFFFIVISIYLFACCKTELSCPGNRVPHRVALLTQANNQRTVNCEVTQSSAPETDPKFVKIVWEGKLPLPPNRPAGQPIDVTFKYDINQVMHCLFKDVGTNEIVEVNLNSKGGEFDNQQKFDSTKDEIDAFLIE